MGRSRVGNGVGLIAYAGATDCLRDCSGLCV